MQKLTDLKNYSPPSKLMKTAGAVVWLITVAVGFYEILLIHDWLMRHVLASFGSGADAFDARYQITLIRSLSFVLLAIGWMFFFIISAFYHFKRLGRPRSWRSLARTSGVLVIIVLITFFV
jgi:hypothetical protein